MRTTVAVWLAAALVAAGCEKSKSETPKNVDAARPAVPAKAQRPQPEPLPPPSDVAAPPADAQRTASGLSYKVIKTGTGTEKPNEWDSVTVHYTGWTTDGKMFDSSIPTKQPASFPLNKVIPGWTEGVQLMVEGEKRRFWIPEELAYKGQPGAPAGMLVFDVELLEIVKK
jgi:peptidylprolyl isomerase